MNARRVGILVVGLVLVAPQAAAHVPAFPADNTTPERAVVVPDPVKSWSFYDSLDTGETAYYRMTLSSGERLVVSTFTPTAGPFTPSVVVMSPSLNTTGAVPPGVTVPDGMGAVVVAGDRPADPSYEMFAPSVNYRTAAYERPVAAETEYVVAVYEPANRSGQVGVVVGYEEKFSPTEYLTVPFSLVRTHLWEGQHPLVVYGPWLVTLTAGAALVRARRRDGLDRRPLRYGLAAAALLVVGSGVSTVLQMGVALAETGPTPAALVTAVYAVVPLVCGGWALRLSLRDALRLPVRTRVGLVVAGLLALVTWAGFIAGPVALLALAGTPRRFVAS
jgi:hypothetical protein